MIRIVLFLVLTLAVWFVIGHWRDWPGLLIAVGALLVVGFVLLRFAPLILERTYALLNRFVVWHRLPTWLAVLNLDALRIVLRKRNLHDVPGGAMRDPAWDPSALVTRTADGSFNDLDDPNMGRAGTRFARNFALDEVYPDEARLLYPSPREISRRLLAREAFIPATSVNLLAAAWIQFQVHGWMAHGKGPDEFHEIPLAPDDDWPERPLRVRKSPVDAEPGNFPPLYVNTESHWWDQSQLYGSSVERRDSLRADGKGRLRSEQHVVRGSDEPRLERNPTTGLEGIDHTGFFDNYWIGLSMLHTLFTLEHNAICDHLRRRNPRWNDDRLFETARLINCALIAKIHTVEWTPALLAHPALKISMNANWWGLFGEHVKRNFGRLSDTEELSGIVGSPTDHHAASFSLTEEFAAVYRMHPLIPDEIRIRSCRTGEELAKAGFTDVQGNQTREFMSELRIADMLYSFGIANPGAITLHNYPDSLRRLRRIRADEPLVDLAAVDILRDRERGVPRYNRFRRLVNRKPAKSFADITSNPAWAREIHDIYDGDIEAVDLLVGLLAEDLPKGFAFSDTAFRIFALMASRRLKSDRFFTADYTPEVYTREGLEWIDDNGFASVLMRHYPDLAPALRGISNPFAAWNPVDRWAAADS